MSITSRLLLVCLLLTVPVPAQEDPYLWLEEVQGDRALAWVREQNQITQKQIEPLPGFSPIRSRLTSIYNSKERIPYVSKSGSFYYNFWRDEHNPRGLLRRTSLSEYRKAAPVWETVLDLDQLAKDEKENWVWHGYSILKPDRDRCLITLSRGGLDSSVVREFDLGQKAFVPSGFNLPEAKSEVSWRNRDSLYVGTDFGPGSLTTSGYPRIVKEWKRGTPLSQATTVFEGQPTDVSVSASVDHDHGRVYEYLSRSPTFFTDEVSVRQGDRWVHIDKPPDAGIDTFGDLLLLTMRSDWTVEGTTYPSGCLLGIDFQAFLKGSRAFTVLFRPTPTLSLSTTGDTKNYMVLGELDMVHSRPCLLRQQNGQWQTTPVEVPALSTAGVSGIDPDESDDYWLTVTDFLTPSRLFMGQAGSTQRELLKSLPSLFDSSGLEVSQHLATSKDGTKVPYFQVAPKGLKLDGSNVTLLNAYGGFEIPLLPGYDSKTGAAWLERGGVYILANLRGGGEFGPSWHNAARKANRQRAYDDFIAVAEDLIARKITSPAHLGIEGRSNGGLLMGVMYTQRPDLFGAVHCGSPLLDMRRYHKLLAGASWMDEYGDPDKPEDWAYIQRYSPYQNVHQDTHYPPILFTTSTKDDRVHPGHARKMAALLESQGHQVLYYENIEGGHGAAANNEQAAYMDSLAYAFLWQKLK